MILRFIKMIFLLTTLRCLINVGVKIKGVGEIFVKFNKRRGGRGGGVKINGWGGGGRNIKKSVNIGKK